ncbi:MAG: hypothetical protein ABI330_11565, partial [Caldimonas sp.]
MRFDVDDTATIEGDEAAGRRDGQGRKGRIQKHDFFYCSDDEMKEKVGERCMGFSSASALLLPTEERRALGRHDTK